MAKKKRVAYGRGGARAKKAVSRKPQWHYSVFADRAPVQPRTFDQIAQASIEKNREVLRELAKY